MDRDWYDNHMQRNWRGAARCIERGGDFGRVGFRSLRALVRTINQVGGIPGFDEILDVVDGYRNGMTIPQAFAMLREASLRAGGSDLTRVAKIAAESTIVAADRGQIRDDLPREMGRRFIERALEHFLFAPSRQRTVGRRFATGQDAHVWQRQCVEWMAPSIEKFLTAMENHQPGARLRAPRRSTPRQATVDLLFQSVT